MSCPAGGEVASSEEAGSLLGEAPARVPVKKLPFYSPFLYRDYQLLCAPHALRCQHPQVAVYYLCRLHLVHCSLTKHAAVVPRLDKCGGVLLKHTGESDLTAGDPPPPPAADDADCS